MSVGMLWALFIYAFIMMIGAFTKRYVKNGLGNLPIIFTGVLTLFPCILAATYLSLYSHNISILFRYSLIPALCALLLWGWRNQELLIKYKQEFVENSIVIALAALVSYAFQFYPYDSFSFERPANNFILGLPIDYKISLMFSESLVQGRLLAFGDWLGSDRPPLFSGAVLFFSVPFVELQDTYLYAGVGTQLILVPVAIMSINELLGKTLRLSDKIIIAFCFVSTPLFFHNLFFLWPKIFAATFLLLAIYSLFISEQKNTLTLRICAAIALALSYLSHGGTAFAIPAIAIVYVLQNRSLRGLGHGCVIFLSFLVLNLPWVFYQKIVQPPGDRLLKWHLLGQIEVVPESLKEVFSEKYRNFEISDLWDRISTSFFLQAKVFDLTSYGLQGATQYVEQSFGRLYLSVGLFSLLIIPILFWRHKIIIAINALILLMALVWFALPFDGAKSMHEGPYILPILIVFNVVLAVFLGTQNWTNKYKNYVQAFVLIVPGFLSFLLFNIHRTDLIDKYELKSANMYQMDSVIGSVIGRDFNDTLVKDIEVYGSFVQSDADIADIEINASNGRYIYYCTGPSAEHQSLRVESNGILLYESSGVVVDRWLRIDLGQHSQVTINLIDDGKQWGQWSAVAMRSSQLSKD